MIVIIGKTASGKDTFLNFLINHCGVKKKIAVTTRPPRVNEKNAEDYIFLGAKEFKEMEDDISIKRGYRVKPDTVWWYGFLNIEDSIHNNRTAIITDLKGCHELIDKYGRENFIIVYVQTDDELRKKRQVLRGDYNETEWNRRNADDEKIYTKENLDDIKVDIIINNNDENKCK